MSEQEGWWVRLAADHVEDKCGRGVCQGDGQLWPCDVSVALAEIDRLRARLAELEDVPYPTHETLALRMEVRELEAWNARLAMRVADLEERV